MPFLSPSADEQALAQADADVLGRVVGVDVQVALGLDGQVDPAVLAQVGEHVVEEADAGVDLVRADAVEVELAADVGLLGLPMYLSDSIFHGCFQVFVYVGVSP